MKCISPQFTNRWRDMRGERELDLLNHAKLFEEGLLFEAICLILTSGSKSSSKFDDCTDSLLLCLRDRKSMGEACSRSFGFHFIKTGLVFFKLELRSRGFRHCL
ncbi:uncharacterized protein LOC115749806 [Rhodamnia argentea]|uniref:Uncharacterized protein LOC115749806 n=1 Tax=Rhodamnia argentea TaxID=178133 RepID=A0ABM3H449_9MYRT|nr:uncharacterized protein LOC115749806 [Rhodamnia argentea]